jgi:FkbM family methyltransferase
MQFGVDTAPSSTEHSPFPADVIRRIAMTASCPDVAGVPKVVGAGEVFEESGVRYQRMHNGLKVIEHGYHGPAMTEIIRRLTGHHEPQEERVFHELLKYVRPGSTMLELGSHWSFYSMWFHSAVPKARNFMIEPDPWNLELGKRNFALNGFEGDFHNASIGRDSAPPAPFHCEYDQVMRDIPRVCVDDFIESRGIDRVELLLCDIQGYELQMLEGAMRSLRSGKIRFAIISTHHHLISDDPLTHQKCLAFVKAQGAHVLAAHSVSESFSGDGLIAVSFLPEDRVLPEIAISRNWASNSLFREVEYDLQAARERNLELQHKVQELEAEVGRLHHAVAALRQSLVNRLIAKARRVLSS